MKTLTHKYITVLILLIFIGQVIATPMIPCSQNQDIGSSAMMMDMQMDIMDSSQMAAMDMDCCGDQCECPDAMCISHVFINSINDLSSYDTAKPFLINTQIVLIQKHLISAIFHPPILS